MPRPPRRRDGRSGRRLANNILNPATKQHYIGKVNFTGFFKAREGRPG
jgi:hypothetical protein